MRLLAVPGVCLVLLTVLGLPAARAQETATDWAWKPLLKRDGVEFTYLYYHKPGDTNDGVVIKIANWNDHAVRYRFQVVFRTDGAEHTEEASGTLRAKEARTGDLDGLYWVPFRDGRPIIEFGLRDYQITPLDGAAADSARAPSPRPAGATAGTPQRARPYGPSPPNPSAPSYALPAPPARPVAPPVAPPRGR